MTIHREGYRILTWTFVLLAALNIAVWFWQDGLTLLSGILLGVSLVILVLFLQFFRSPGREPSYNDKYVIAPADGKVVAIEKVYEKEFFKDDRIQVSIFMSPFNVHVNWYPVSGRIRYLRYHYGKYLVAWHPKSSSENERTTIVIEKENKSAVMVKQIAGAVAKRIIYYPHEGDLIRQGAELGFIRFGSRVDVLLPVDAKVSVKLGEKTRGNDTVLAELV